MSDLRQLRHFVALAEHGHFARAADAVNLSQPALSRSIQALEGQLSCQLVDRNPRGVTLTAHGKLVLEHARRLLAGDRALKNAVLQMADLETGELRLGAGPFPGARLMPQVLTRYCSAHPKVSVLLSIENWSELHQRLLDDELELFIADYRELEGDNRLDILPLRVHRSVLFCRPGHPLIGSAPSVERLLDFPLAGPRLPRDAHEGMVRTLGRDQPLSVQCDDVLMLKELVKGSDVLCLATWDVVAADVQAGSLAILPWPGGTDASGRGSAYALVRHASRSLSPAASQFVELLLEEDAAFNAAS
ncbi:LysR family transcriptional regulator [Pseudomonas nicosulfuronedens]|uniref:LysR family transcriptional regulator n=1 Tax=Pseudomonas nicosulfuronedens TaxID=2571105 RepID=A0A5R9R9E4_9PSED|nr:LysR family transcriptional regulator [Pseudomonas nicosulfuronedens]MDH1007541.1 LysR family transcriptional regulator [Pseudomonas nicosulfuronedens]MDH1977587.1 LysR family transcriptional regulator [Pseudomonas nicosulfuronedens]MDH2025814.1 LysR family transcriptional regulator [Pseudomonas nicosulfuronedens]TLX79718.1 LysR family transcriptional regulator [Pseudomonas nicosulfuronedens]